MSLFGKILKTTIDIATIPVSVIKDAATMGGALTEEDRPYTIDTFERIGDDVNEIRDEVDNL